MKSKHAKSDPLQRVASKLDIGGPVVVIVPRMSFVASTICAVKLMQCAWPRIAQRRPAERALACWQGGQPKQTLSMDRGTALSTQRCVG
jgi:hypothetical protein